MSHRAPERVVGVSGMIANESPAPGTAVIRSLRASPSFNGKVVGLAYDAMEAGNFIEGVADEVFLVPYPSQGHEDYFKRLLYIKQRTGLNALIPTLDAELLPIIQMSDWLKAKGIATFLPTQEQFRLRAKDQLFQMAARHALPVPRSLSLFDPAMLWSLDREVRYPLLIKGIFYEAYLARDPQEAAAHFEKIRQKWGLPVVVQEFVPGDEYDVAAVGDGRGGVVGAVPMRKMQLSDKGKAWAGVTVSDDKLMELARKTIKALKWRGPLELEVMKSRGAYYIIEINPRFPAWIYLAQGAGQNLPLACLELALGRTPAPFAPHKPGVVFMRSAMDFIMPMSKLQALTADGECHEYGSQKV
ncbi:MAG: ATP-grasp domain-containing protein [Elusimicrobia bacterium]|nr:ATP-grasp domain-containing protein [Elusimicrobiota bacterium]